MKKRKAKKRAKNPAPKSRPMLYVIRAKAKGPTMHYNGEKFTNNGRAKLFPTMASAELTARALISRYPQLRKYRVTIHSNF